MVYMLRRRKLGRTSCRTIAEKSGGRIRYIRNDARLPQDATTVIRWGCLTPLPPNVKVINSVEAISRVNDKAGFRKILQDADPKLVPETWFRQEDVKFPAVIRPKAHHQGKKLYVVNNEIELRVAIAQAGFGWYGSRLINKIAEYRVFVVQGRVPCVASKRPGNINQVAWNVAQGGAFESMRWDDWPLKVIRVAIEGWKHTGLTIGAVDVMVDAENNCYILEVNSAPSITSEYRQAQMAKAISSMVEKGYEDIPLINDRGGWKKFIHPACSPEALMVGV